MTFLLLPLFVYEGYDFHIVSSLSTFINRGRRTHGSRSPFLLYHMSGFYLLTNANARVLVPLPYSPIIESLCANLPLKLASGYPDTEIVNDTFG
jgi:hypothetical protein